MTYVIMCGGEYKVFSQPRPLTEICGERLIERTIRLLKENGQTDIVITSNDPVFDQYGKRLEHENSYVAKEKGQDGCWLDAFYPYFDDDMKVTYLYGDVWYSEDAMRKIVSCEKPGNVLFGTSVAKNHQHKNWGEPFAYVVRDYRTFMCGVDMVKQMWKAGNVNRNPLTWELYRYLNGFDVNVQRINDDTYVCIDDLTADIDSPEQVWLMERKIERG